jgi:hypothetical protein
MIIAKLNCKYKFETCNSNLYIYGKYAFDIKIGNDAIFHSWVNNTLFRILSVKYPVR